MNSKTKALLIGYPVLILLSFSGCQKASPVNPAEDANPGITLRIQAGSAHSERPSEDTSLELSVPIGTKVIWINEDGEDHSITSTSGEWDSGRLAPSARFAFEFKEPGSFTYASVFHPHIRGTIHVE